MIVYTGSTGSIGSDMPPGPIPLKTRLEESVEQMNKELEEKTSAPFSMIHLSGLASVMECERSPEKAYELNVNGSLKWFQAAEGAGCKRFIYVSSAHVFAAPPKGQSLNIHSPVGPRSVYAKTKLEAETALKKYSENSKTELIIARVFSIWPKLHRPGYLITNLHIRAQKKDFSPLSGLYNVRDYIKTDEICKQLVALTEEPFTPTVLICTGHGRTIQDVAVEVFAEYGLDGHLLKEAAGRPDDIQYIVGTPYEFKNKQPWS
ncbi:MAG: NAD-dependent epimerase/dehydratase family protein [Bdellovibrionales bacterium]